MSSALAIAAVTAVLKSLLDNCLIRHGGAAGLGDVTVSALPPDRIPLGTEERSQLNLFMYRVTPNSAWRPRARGEPGRGAPVAASRGSPGRAPLALDLHYLLTAYGEQDLQAEILLGFGMQVFHAAGVMPRDTIRSALNGPVPGGAPSVVPPARAALTASTLADQVEEVTITPEFISPDDSSKLWSTLQAHYRPSTAYRVSAVLIEADR